MNLYRKKVRIQEYTFQKTICPALYLGDSRAVDIVCSFSYKCVLRLL